LYYSRTVCVSCAVNCTAERYCE